MKAEFSELRFGAAYTFELSNLWANHLFGAPEFPSQIKEGRKNGGYDVKLDSTNGFVYCVQFKRSEYMTRSTASETLRGYGELPYFRFRIYANYRSEQHQLLLNLEDSGLKVEYVAPLFIGETDLNDGFRNKNLRENVFRVRPSVIGNIEDENEHRVVFDQFGRTGTLYSDPVVLKSPFDYGEITEEGFKSSIPDDQEDIGDDISKDDPPTIQSQLEMFLQKVSAIAMVPRARFLDLGLTLVEEARAAARIFLGAELFIFCGKEETSEE